MRRAIVVLIGGLVLGASSVPALASGLEVRVGRFFPRASSSLFAENIELYLYDGQDLRRSDWDGWTGGIERNFRAAPKLEVGFHLRHDVAVTVTQLVEKFLVLHCGSPFPLHSHHSNGALRRQVKKCECTNGESQR